MAIGKSTTRQPLMWSEGIRAFICMIPMLVAAALGKTEYLVTLGQGGFFFASLFLPAKLSGRMIMGSLIIGLGLGFYLIGGAVVINTWMAVIFTFLVCVNLSFLSSWKLGGPLALTLIMIYTAGLNTGSPEKASANFLVFALVLAWCALISLLPFWKPIDPPPVNTDQKNTDLAEQGTRMGIGASIALAISYIFDFAKLGWAPSAVGNVVRFDEKLSKKRAWARTLGTIGGAVVASVVFAFVTDLTTIVLFGALFAVVNGIFKKTKIGAMPFFYTATILLLYSANSLDESTIVTLQRVFYNLVGVMIGIAVVVLPFPYLMKKINPKTKISP